MPIYEYRCEKCAHEFEVMQKIADKPIKKCEKCGAKVEKKMSLSGFQLKGSGWYADGYAKSSGEKENKKDSPKKKADAPKTESKTTPTKSAAA